MSHITAQKNCGNWKENPQAERIIYNDRLSIASEIGMEKPSHDTEERKSLTELEEKIMDKLFPAVDLKRKDFPDFTENDPIFVNDSTDGKGLQLDSLDSLEMTLMIEKEWNLPEIDGEDIKRLRTVKGIAEYIQEKKGL